MYENEQREYLRYVSVALLLEDHTDIYIEKLQRLSVVRLHVKPNTPASVPQQPKGL